VAAVLDGAVPPGAPDDGAVGPLAVAAAGRLLAPCLVDDVIHWAGESGSPAAVCGALAEAVCRAAARVDSWHWVRWAAGDASAALPAGATLAAVLVAAADGALSSDDQSGERAATAAASAADAEATVPGALSLALLQRAAAGDAAALPCLLASGAAVRWLRSDDCPAAGSARPPALPAVSPEEAEGGLQRSFASAVGRAGAAAATADAASLLSGSASARQPVKCAPLAWCLPGWVVAAVASSGSGGGSALLDAAGLRCDGRVSSRLPPCAAAGGAWLAGAATQPGVAAAWEGALGHVAPADASTVRQRLAFWLAAGSDAEAFAAGLAGDGAGPAWAARGWAELVAAVAGPAPDSLPAMRKAVHGIALPPWARVAEVR